MSRLLVTNKSFELLEPYEGKLSRTVLRGESSRKGADLLDMVFHTCEKIVMQKIIETFQHFHIGIQIDTTFRIKCI